MVGILILSHGTLAKELLASAQVISGNLSDFRALALDWHDSLEEARRKVSDVLPALDQGDGVLILTDMYGSTPFNVALGFRQAGKIEVVAGVNLPMVVRLGCLTSKPAMPLAEMADWIRDKGRSSICGCRAAEPSPDCEGET